MIQKLTTLGAFAALAGISVPAPTLAGDARAGKTTYDANCAACHGTTGMGDGPLSGALIPGPRDFSSGEFMFDTDDDSETGTDADLAAVIEQGAGAFGGNPLMASWQSALSADEVENVIAYVRTLETACAAAPRDGCRTTTTPGGSRLDLKKKRGKLAWSWKGEATTKAEFADPTSSTGYSLCVYDEVDDAQELVLGAALPSGSRWREKNKGFKYRRSNGKPDGIRKLSLKEGGAGKAKIKVDGKGVDMRMLPLAQDSRVITQLLIKGEVCWEATYTASASKNSRTRFKDVSD